jgi:hypothetical protein
MRRAETGVTSGEALRFIMSFEHDTVPASRNHVRNSGLSRDNKKPVH